MRPQFGSPPCQLVFTRALLATARAAASASAKLRAPLTRTVTKREAPSPSRMAHGGWRIFREAVGQEEDCIVRAHVAVHGDPVETMRHRDLEKALQERC